MSDYKEIIKSNVMAVELDKKEVKITCQNNKAGKATLTSLTQNISIFDGKNYDLKTGLTAKDFKFKFKKKDHAETFYNNVMDIVTDPSVKVPVPAPEQEPGPDGAPAPSAGSEDTSGNKTVLIIGGAVALILVIVLAIWAASK